MGTGILICGLNGCGKSTLGKALAERMGFYFIDHEDLYFPGRGADGAYVNPQTRAEAERLLMDEVVKHPDFVFAAVKADCGEAVVSRYSYVVVMEAPSPIRSRKVRDRSFRKFGSRMLTGGDLYEQEEAFFRKAESRREQYVEAWLEEVTCPIIRVDGTKPIEDNVEYIVGKTGG